MRFFPSHSGQRDDEGSLPMAMLVSLVAMSLSAAMVPTVVNQITTTRTAETRTEALDAAQSGIDAALAQLRSAGTLDSAKRVVGSVSSLPPCSMSGTTDSTGQRYSITIEYYGLPDSVTDTTPVKLSCPPGSLPRTAVVTATGSGSGTVEPVQGKAGTRTLQGSYTFLTNNENISGGAIRLDSPAGKLCMAYPATGTNGTVAACKTGGSDEQRFSYTKDLNIQLAGSQNTSATAGLCLDAAIPRSNGQAVTFKPCLGRVARQQWSLNDSSLLQGTNDGVNLESWCLNAKNSGGTGDIVIGGCGASSTKNIWRMEAAAGAGMASGDTKQLVNYKQFSRCLDVTNHSSNPDYLIAWFCKQAPNGAVSWNQQWTLPAAAVSAATAVPERIRTLKDGTTGLCLITPTSITGYVKLTSCAATGPITEPRMKWTVYGDTGDPTTSYRIVDSNGYCLQPSDLDATSPEVHTDGTAKIKVAPCTKSELQKWNAPANYDKSMTVSGLKEK
jgi:hypothetical protein